MYPKFNNRIILTPTMLDPKTQDRYYNYILTYIETISKSGKELEQRCKKRRAGDITINRRSYMYFATKTGVTLVNKKTTLELTFVFNKEEGATYFETENLHNFIESDLNVSGLGRYFTSNKSARSELYNQCLEELLQQDLIQKKDEGFVILDEEEY